jgi:hypothetical protein
VFFDLRFKITTVFEGHDLCDHEHDLSCALAVFPVCGPTNVA